MAFADGLSHSQKEILFKQIQRFNNCIKLERRVVVPGEKVILPKGTRIHGTPYNEKIINSISKGGIITGQFFDIPEDNETFFCADFHKVPDDMTLDEYAENFTYRDGRCPFRKNLGKETIGLILFPDERSDEITKYDCFEKDTVEGKITRDFVNESGLPIDDKEMVSGILFGIPSSFITGIAMGDLTITIENVKRIISLFPGAFITRASGEIIYRDGDSMELLEERVKSVQRECKVEELENEKKELENKLEDEVDEKEELWDAIAKLSIESIAEIYKELGWQGEEEDFIRFAKDLKSSRGDTNKTL